MTPTQSHENAYALPQEAGRSPLVRAARSRLKRVAPMLWAYRTTRQAGTELRMYVHSVRGARRLRNDPDAAHRFNAQTVSSYPAPAAAAASPGELIALLDQAGLAYERLGSAILLAAQPRLAEVLGAAPAAYPADTAFLIAAEDVPTSSWREHLLAGTLLHAEGVGVRVYDLLELTATGRRLPALALAPTGTESGDDDARQTATAKIATLCRPDSLLVGTPGWQDARHFRSATDGRTLFVRPDLLAAPRQNQLIQHALDSGADRDLHFGRESTLLGGRYLYQSVPAAGRPGRRDTDRRWECIRDLLATEGLSVRDRVVLDVGCNAGLMLGAALSEGARWGVGWDRQTVVPHSRSLLGALGHTRVDLHGADLEPDFDLLAGVPEHLHAELPNAVVFYLAIRHHVGFLKGLATLPWRTMVYEGGETESVERLDAVLEDLRALCDFRIAAAVDFRDSESLPRPLAILVRE